MESLPPAPSHSQADPVPDARTKRWPWVVAAGLVALVVLITCARDRQPARKGFPGADRPVPVLATAVRSGDLSLSLTGLGTVTPLATVTVRSRVDGQLVQVAFKEGQQVSQGQLLVQLDPRPFQVQLMQAEGQLAKDKAALENAQLDLARYRNLTRQGILAQQQLDAQSSQVDQIKAAIQADQATVASARLNLTYSRITAPIAGRVGLRLVDPGNIVHATDAGGIAVITPLAPMDVLFTVPADSIQRVLARMRQSHPPVVEAWDRDMTRCIAQGVLVAVDNQVDPATGTVKLKARFPNRDNALFPDQFVNAKLLVDTLHDARLIPTAALQRGPQGTYVYVVDADRKVALRPVAVEATEGDTTAIRTGLKAGELVVTDGMEKLRPGSRVSLAGSSAPGNPRTRP